MSTDLLSWFAIMAVAVAYYGLKFLKHNGVIGNSGDGPILGSQDLLNSGPITSVDKGVLEGFEYNVIAGGNGKLVVFVQLHKNTGLHLIATNSYSLLDHNNDLVRVELEGDFPESFSTYCAPGNENQLLQLFDPAEMAYFVDFCLGHNFELYKDSMYFSRADNMADAADDTVLFKDVAAFLKNNKNLLARIEA